MRLYLVQHAQAMSKEEHPERPLSSEGLSESRKMAAFIKPEGLRVQAIWHSGKMRAAQTADVLASVVESEQGAVAHDGLNPNDPVKPITGQIKRADSDLMIVGHMPFLNDLASQLLVGKRGFSPVKFRNAGIVCLERETNDQWSLCWMIIPDQLV